MPSPVKVDPIHHIDVVDVALRASERTNRDINAAIEIALDHARHSTPYRYGAKNGAALDCSGLISRCFEGHVPDGAARQRAALADVLYSVDVPLPAVGRGDLLFFAAEEESQRPVHVAMALSADAHGVELVESSEIGGCVSAQRRDWDDILTARAFRLLDAADIRMYLFESHVAALLISELTFLGA